MKKGTKVLINHSPITFGNIFTGTTEINNFYEVINENNEILKVHKDDIIELKKRKITMEFNSTIPDAYDRELYGEKRYFSIDIYFDKVDEILCNPIIEYIEERTSFKFDGFGDSDSTHYSWCTEYVHGEMGEIKEEMRDIWKEVKKVFNLR